MLLGIGQGGLVPGLPAHPLPHGTDSELFAQTLEKATRKASKTQDGAREEDEVALRAAARDVEAYFLKEMLASMRKTVPSGGLFEKSFAKETYEAMLDEKLAEEMAKAGGIGLGELIVKQLRERDW